MRNDSHTVVDAHQSLHPCLFGIVLSRCLASAGDAASKLHSFLERISENPTWLMFHDSC